MADSISDALQANPSAETEGADHKSAISEPEPESAAYDESAANKSDVVEAKNVPSADDARVDSEAEQHPVDEDSAKATEPSAKSESDSSHPDVSETLRSTEKDADAKLDQESKTKDKNAPESSTISVPAGPRGRFGTKTGLAAKRKASESSEEDAERNDVVFLLKSANFFSADELEDAIINSLRDQNKAIEILGILGIIDKSNLDAAVRLQKLVKSGSVDVNKAIESLTDLKSGKLRASELTEQLGIKKSKRRK
jgi:hypothetical protein